MKFKKGSAAAKAYMAKIRAKRGKPKKVGEVQEYCIKKGNLYLTRKSLTGDYVFTDNENFRYTWDSKQQAEKIAKHYGGKAILNKFHATLGKKAAPKKTARKKVGKKAAPKKAARKKAVKKAATHKDTKSHNVNIKVVSGLSKSKKLKNALKKDGLKLPHGYSLEKRKIGSLTTDRIRQSLELITTYEDNLKTYLESTGGKFNTKDFKATRAKFIKFYRASLKEEKIHLKELKKLI